jgi:hypothetical protein
MRLSALGILFAAVPVFAQVKQLKVEGAPFKLTVILQSFSGQNAA